MIDPMAEEAYSWTPYRCAFNNPLKFIDPNGMLESLHTDENGNVVAAYEDGDLGVYKHKGNADKAKKEVEEKCSDKNTSAGGEKRENLCMN